MEILVPIIQELFLQATELPQPLIEVQVKVMLTLVIIQLFTQTQQQTSFIL